MRVKYLPVAEGRRLHIEVFPNFSASGSLTVKEMKRKGCLGKQCRHLQKNEQHEYWKQRELAKARKEK